jgi:hypothetical protein
MEKITKTFRFEKDVIEHSEKNPNISSFAEWCSEQYKKQFMSEQYYKEQIELHQQQIKLNEQHIKDLSENNLNILNPYELEWIKQVAPGRIKNSTEEGVYRFFVNTYNRKDINRRQFRLLVEKHSKNNEK